eukprot:3511021-Rhodomonas_salina.1
MHQPHLWYKMRSFALDFAQSTCAENAEGVLALLRGADLGPRDTTLTCQSHAISRYLTGC